ncbi:hypothetical protein [Campylobacter sp. RM16187]|uniref:hypothetical protein n=1 Tax=Campylobacter sp. RM16187 TaxID=1660063 RepID=UPI0021B67B68|nr:hypothetical protein [Campylobacter sp. RM16187]QKG29202.1 hypothetical protein CDOMF_0939 [Campylobacter sp. RM16187]
MSEIKLLPEPKSKFRRWLVLALGAVFIILFSIAAYSFYERLFYNKDIALTAWAVTQGVINVLLSPAKLLTIFKA